MSGFVDKLHAAARTNGSLLCVGLDPDPNLMPVQDVAAFNRAIIDATSDLVCAYKPNLGFFEALGRPGLEALERTLDCIRDKAPNAVVIGDAKRGDIHRFYAKAMFESWGFDAATVHPYAGRGHRRALPRLLRPGRLRAVPDVQTPGRGTSRTWP